MDSKPDSLLALTAGSPEGIYERQTGIHPVALYAAWAYQMRHNDQGAEMRSTGLRIADVHAEGLSEDWRYHAARGLALAGLGRRGEALHEARWLQGSGFYREDAIQGPHAVEARALILAQCGETDAALGEIERLLNRPGTFSVRLLRLDPRWDPIRKHPRFMALLVKYANPERFAY